MTKDELSNWVESFRRLRLSNHLAPRDEAIRDAVIDYDVTKDQRDRALALLREDESGRSACRIFFETEPCRRPAEPCWEHRARALLAEVGEVGE